MMITPDSWGTALREADGEHKGILLALWVGGSPASKALAPYATEMPRDMHITLAYCKTGTFEAATRVAQAVARRFAPLSGRVVGAGTFPKSKSSDDKIVVWAKPYVAGMKALRRALVPALTKAGVIASTTHEWNPHITLAYVDKKTVVPTVPAIPLRFLKLTVMQGDRRKDFRLGGA